MSRSYTPESVKQTGGQRLRVTRVAPGVPGSRIMARIDLLALEANYRSIVAYLAAEKVNGCDSSRRQCPGVIGVVKADAYGHGAVPVARVLESAGISMLAVADVDEGVALRGAGIRAGLLVCGPLNGGDLDAVFDHSLIPTVTGPEIGRELETSASARRVVQPYHLKIDTGMNRLGFRHDTLHATLPALLSSPYLRLEAVYTHFCTADDLRDDFFDTQRRRFDEACRLVESFGVAPLRHAAGSAALLRDSRVWFDFVRPGLLLYGLVPPPLSSTIALKPVMSLASQVVALKAVGVGESIGYGRRVSAERPMTIALVPAGYANGIDRRLEGRGSVLIRGRRRPVIGAISMGMLTVDISDVPGVELGDEVLFLGSHGTSSDQTIDGCELAAMTGTIPYDLLCRIGAATQKWSIELDGLAER